MAAKKKAPAIRKLVIIKPVSNGYVISRTDGGIFNLLAPPTEMVAPSLDMALKRAREMLSE